MIFRTLKSLKSSARRATRRAVTCRAATRAVVMPELLESRRVLAAVTNLALINADTDTVIRSLANNTTVTIDLKSARKLNVRADATSAASVRFGFDSNSNYRTEGSSPFAFAGNDGADYTPWTPSVGTHTLIATAYSGANATGSASSQYKVTLKIVDTTGPTPTPPPEPTPNPPPTNPSTSPFLGSAPSIPAQTILFDNFDNGGEGVAYHDTDTTNQGGMYRGGGVDIETTSDSAATNLQSSSGGGRNVGNVHPGEWLKYTVNVTKTATYKFEFRFASGNAGGTAHLEVDGKNVTGAITLGGTGGWQTWKTLEKTGVALTAGSHVLKFVVDSTKGGDVGNLHWFRFSESNTTQPPPSSTLAWPGSWSAGPSAPGPRFESAGMTFGGKIYTFGGFKNDDFDVDRTYASFDPNTNKWTTLGTMPVGMAETHTGHADDGKYIYFVGGFAGDFIHTTTGPTQIASNKVWRYEPATNKWTQLASLPSARGAGGAAVVNGKLHYFGGNPSDRVTNIPDHLVLDLNNPSAGWQNAAPMPDAKDHFSVVTIGTKIYLLGGEKGHDKLADIQKSVHVYDTADNSWTRLADMPLTNSHAEGTTFLMDGYIVFAGGQYNHAQESTARVVAYNPATNTWKELAPLPKPRQGAIIGVFGNKVVITLGAQWTVQAQSNTWIGYR